METFSKNSDHIHISFTDSIEAYLNGIKKNYKCKSFKSLIAIKDRLNDASSIFNSSCYLELST